MLEAIALIGALLLALDRQIHGTIRERAVVAYYRLKGGAQVTYCPACMAFTHCLFQSSDGLQAHLLHLCHFLVSSYTVRVTREGRKQGLPSVLVICDVMVAFGCRLWGPQ